MEIPLEERVSRIEKFVDWAKPVLEETMKVLELSRPRVNPIVYCSDEIDRKIISYLIERKAGTATEVAEFLGEGRHRIGKRIARLAEKAKRDGWDLLEFHPERKEGHFRAWWLLIENIDIEGFKKSLA